MMKLSEAIKLGAMLHPQSRGGEIVRETRNSRTLGLERQEVTHTCAMGAAFLANGCEEAPADPNVKGLPMRGEAGKATRAFGVPVEWIIVLGGIAACPECSGRTLLVSQMIPHLNDDHRWTRERIADFVEQIENQQARILVPAEQGQVQ